MQKVKIEKDWLIAFVLMVLLTIMGFYAGRTAERELECKPVFDLVNNIIDECNEKLLESQHLPREFNLSKVLENSNMTLQWNKTTMIS